MIALVLLTHEEPERVRRMVDFWKEATNPSVIVVAYGGPRSDFDKLDCRKAFIEDQRLRTRDHQRERQSYTGVLRGALEEIADDDWEWLYLAEYDMLPLDKNVLPKLAKKARDEGASLLGHRMWRLEDTLHPHYSSHLFTSKWMSWIASISTRNDPKVVLSCMGCGQFWHRKALQDVIALGEPEPAYLELQLPTAAHHLGYRVRGLTHQDKFISNSVIKDASAGLLRDTGGWVMHPLKDIWKSEGTSGFVPTGSKVLEFTEQPSSQPESSKKPMARGWLGDLKPVLERIGTVAAGRHPFRMLRAGNRLAIGLPNDAEAARIVLDLYHPNRLPGRVFRLYAQTLLRTGLSKRIIKPEGGTEERPLVDWLRSTADAGRVGFVGGNPSHGPRCLLGGLCETEDGNWEPFVGKLGFDESRDAIEREWRTLTALSSRFAGVLCPISFDAGNDWALLRLPHLGYRAPGNMADTNVLELLTKWWGDEWQILGENNWVADLLARAESCGVCPKWCERVRGLKVRSALLHGDFAIWNIRLLPHGPCAIDWEWAEEHGVAGVDLAHGLRQEAVMVRRLSPGGAVRWILARAKKTPIHAHLRGCGWGDDLEDWLAFCLLHSHFNAKSDSVEFLAELGLNLVEEKANRPSESL